MTYKSHSPSPALPQPDPDSVRLAVLKRRVPHLFGSRRRPRRSKHLAMSAPSSLSRPAPAVNPADSSAVQEIHHRIFLKRVVRHAQNFPPVLDIELLNMLAGALIDTPLDPTARRQLWTELIKQVKVTLDKALDRSRSDDSSNDCVRIPTDIKGWIKRVVPIHVEVLKNLVREGELASGKEAVSDLLDTYQQMGRVKNASTEDEDNLFNLVFAVDKVLNSKYQELSADDSVILPSENLLRVTSDSQLLADMEASGMFSHSSDSTDDTQDEPRNRFILHEMLGVDFSAAPPAPPAPATVPGVPAGASAGAAAQSLSYEGSIDMSISSDTTPNILGSRLENFDTSSESTSSNGTAPAHSASYEGSVDMSIINDSTPNIQNVDQPNLEGSAGSPAPSESASYEVSIDRYIVHQSNLDLSLDATPPGSAPPSPGLRERTNIPKNPPSPRGRTAKAKEDVAPHIASQSGRTSPASSEGRQGSRSGSRGRAAGSSDPTRARMSSAYASAMMQSTPAGVQQKQKGPAKRTNSASSGMSTDFFPPGMAVPQWQLQVEKLTLQLQTAQEALAKEREERKSEREKERAERERERQKEREERERERQKEREEREKEVTLLRTLLEKEQAERKSEVEREREERKREVENVNKERATEVGLHKELTTMWKERYMELQEKEKKRENAKEEKKA